MFKKRFPIFLFLAIGMVFSIAASHVQTRFRAHLTGNQEVPPVATDAEGRVSFSLNNAGTELTYKLQVQNIAGVFGAHIHAGAPGVNGPVLVTLCGVPGTAPACSGPDGVLHVQGTITQMNDGQPLGVLLDAMRSGNTYVNVHTPDAPGGEVRGQIR
jgi:hypothetical protein